MPNLVESLTTNLFPAFRDLTNYGSSRPRELGHQLDPLKRHDFLQVSADISDPALGSKCPPGRDISDPALGSKCPRARLKMSSKSSDVVFGFSLLNFSRQKESSDTRLAGLGSVRALSQTLDLAPSAHGQEIAKTETCTENVHGSKPV
jgi:hypothetical protein